MNESALYRKAKYKPWLQGLAPWVNWTSEIYGLGKCIREIYGYPYFYPLFFKSDHGVDLLAAFEKHEIYHDNLPFLTWKPDKFNIGKTLNLDIFLIEHPWVTWRKLRNINQDKNAKDTIIFLPHGTDDLGWNFKEISFLLKSKKNEFLKQGNVSIVMHWRDVIEKRYRYFSNDYNLLTTGNSNSIFFPNKFYAILKHYKRLITFGLDTPVFYGLELGLEVKIIDFVQYTYNKLTDKETNLNINDLYVTPIDWTHHNNLLNILKTGFHKKDDSNIDNYLYLSMGVGVEYNFEFKEKMFKQLYSNLGNVRDLYIRDLKKIFKSFYIR